MIVYEQNILTGDKLIMPMLCKVDHTKHKDEKGEASLWTLMGGE
jgi:hypothetical protein